MPNASKPISLRPLTGPLDFRTTPDSMANGSVRFRQNFSSRNADGLDRSNGFLRFIGGNADMHDQLLPLQTYYDYKKPKLDSDEELTELPNSTRCGSVLNTRANGREMPTFGWSFKTEVGHRTIVGTRSRLLVLNESTQNYRIIADGLGGDGAKAERFYGAYLNGKAVLTNGINQPVYWPIDGKANGCEMQSVKRMKDLDLINLSKAGFVVEFSGCVFLMDITLDGVRFPNRYVWSDANDGTSFDPAVANSITGLDQVAPGHTILWAAPLLGSLVIYTDHGIFRVSATGSSPAFQVTEVYSSDEGARCLAYRNAAVNLGTSHVIVGADGIYTYDPYKLQPEREEWIHQASGVMFDGIEGYNPINKDACEATIAGYRPGAGKVNEGEIYISWAETGYTYPTKTLVLNTALKFASTVDHGFSLFFDYLPNTRVSVRDFLLDACACRVQELSDLGLGFVKEGQPTSGCGSVQRDCIYTKTIAPLDGYDTENWYGGEADGTSLCNYLDGATLDDLCKACEIRHTFVGASTTDWCLKALGEGYVREMCVNADTATGPNTPYQNIGGAYSSFTGQYSLSGYYSVLRGSPQSFNTRTDKTIKRFIADVVAAAQASPCVLQLRIGMSYNVTDPNKTGLGGVIWYQPERRLLQTVDALTPEEYVAQNIRPNLGIEFPLDRTGMWLYWEITVGSLSDPNDLSSTLLPAVGGSSTFSGIWQTIRQKSAYVK